MPKHPNIGSSLDDFLKQEGIQEEAEGHAIKEVIAWQFCLLRWRAKASS